MHELIQKSLSVFHEMRYASIVRKTDRKAHRFIDEIIAEWL